MRSINGVNKLLRWRLNQINENIDRGVMNPLAWFASILALFSVLLLSGCRSTQEPQYPAQLQMIIAQSASQQQAPQQTAQPTQPISVEQLLAAVKHSANARPAQQHATNDVSGQDFVPDWVFKGENRQSEPLATLPDTQRQLQLHYQDTQLLPQKMQLMMAQQMLKVQHMTVVKLVIGGSQEDTAFARAATAAQRAAQLMASLGDKRDATVEYQPKIGDNIVIVTFEPVTF